ncbi:MAG: tRNA 2-thiouridine(34) synthase MnmA [Planctomycetota bacterium]|jgi:tRNA-specific 2-thiouridylase
MAARSVVVAMSGGVDSSVAALLLTREGYDVTGLFMRTGIHADAGNPRSCCNVEDGRDARRVAEMLDIPFYALNFEREFTEIVDYFVSEYRGGRTPNPCIVCNRDLKFGRLLAYASAAGADHVATGHYASVVRREGRLAIRGGSDDAKDQSYVLFPLSQKQLGRTVLPLGDLSKDDVRRLAEEAGLPVSAKPESQEICFVSEGGYRRLLEGRGVGTPGPIVTREGREVGRHTGYEFFTVGQRRGLGRAFGEPRYVTDIDPDGASVTVGPIDELRRPGLVAGGWVGGALPEPLEGESFAAEVKIRYRHAPAAATVTGMGGGRVRVWFGTPQTAVTPGQAAVAYDGDVVLGGGWIDAAETD